MFVALSIVGGLTKELCITCGDAIASEQVLSSKSRGFGDTGFSRSWPIMSSKVPESSRVSVPATSVGDDAAA